MTRYEKTTVGSLCLLATGYAGFLIWMGIADRASAGAILRALMLILALLAAGHVALWVTVWSRGGLRGDAVPDEREERIELLADRFGYIAAEIGLGLLLVMALAEGAGWKPLPVSLFGMPGLVLWLVTASFIVAAARLTFAVFLSRRAGG